MSVITLLTDFGTQDAFVGVMKGVIKSLAPQADIIDLTHQIPPQDIAAGAFVLKTAYAYFPPGTIHLAVVDPGVGSARRPIAAHVGEHFCVGPDNGLLSYVLSQHALTGAVILDDRRYHLPDVSRTFHGRDIFAPAAAHLSNGVLLATLGTPLETLQTIPLSAPIVGIGTLTCHVLYCDVFGNLFTDLTDDTARPELSSAVFRAGGAVIHGLSESYSQLPPGSPLALFGSSGHLEIAVHQGNARETLGLRVGDTITIKTAPDDPSSAG